MKNIIIIISVCLVSTVFGQNIRSQKPLMKLIGHSQVNLQDIHSTYFPGGPENEMNTKQVIFNKANSPQTTGSKSLQNPELLTNEITQLWEKDGPGNLETINPPDPCGDIGFNYYVQANNNYFIIYDKSGNISTDHVSFWDFWDFWEKPEPGQAKQFYSDPIVLFDEVENRWVMCEVGIDATNSDYPGCYFFIASSSGDNPNSSWDTWWFYSNDKLFDFPKLGCWKDGIYFSANIFQMEYTYPGIDGSAIATAGGAFNKEEMYNGSNYLDYDYEFINFKKNNGDPWSLLPFDNDGNYADEGQKIYFGWFSDDDGKGYTTDALHFIPATFNGSSFSFELNDQITLPVESFVSDAGLAYNYECSSNLDVLNDRLNYRIQFRQFNDHASIVCCHEVQAPNVENMNAMRWYEVRTNSKGLYLYQQGTFTLEDKEYEKRDRWMGSIAMNEQGEIALGYNMVREHDPNNYSKWIAIGLTGRKSTDEPNQMTFQEVDSRINNCMEYNKARDLPPTRWGDYSMMSVDPSDGSTFWYTAELPKNTGEEPGWISRTIAFELDPCIDELLVQNKTVNSGESIDYSAFSLLQAAGNDNSGNASYFTINNGGSSEFISNKLIKLEAGFRSYEGSYFHAVNDYCNSGGNKKSYFHKGGPNNIYVPRKSSGVFSQTENNSLIIVPNPTDGLFTIKTGDNIYGKVQVLDLSGVVVFSSGIYDEKACIIDLSANNPGIYIVKFTGENIVVNKKIILY